MDQLTLQPIRHIQGEIQLPGSKSLSLRLLLLSALAQGTTEVYNLLDSDDTRHLITALRQLGVNLTLSQDKSRCQVQGMGGPLPATHGELYLGNSGTGSRPLCAILCLGKGEFTVTGEPRLWERPIKDLVDALAQIGARIEYLKSEGYPPVRIHADGLIGGKVSIRGNISSQYLTALLLAAPLAQQDTLIEVEGELVSQPYIDITLDVIRRFGGVVEHSGYQSFRVPGKQRYQSPGKALVEGDASSATYFLAAAAIKGGTVRVNGVGSDSVQGDVELASVLEQMGAVVKRGADWIEVSRGDLHGVDLDLNRIPDAAMTVATTALFAKGKTTIRNVHNWRVKETDRLAAMAAELRKVGAEVIEGSDYLEITPPERIKAATIDTYNDHRMAMSFSLAALGDSEIIINDPACVSKTFPDYFEQLAAISK
ncbi:MAG: 3-phosphoshikimate 1-carboxyvinyltransferase [Chloroflexi bacterium]|nr:3-phosphoshikimate 1-carboxyvinyltransferase [Chloroflexota bacterium]